MVDMATKRSERAFIIVNPKAQNGRAGKEWPELERIIKADYHGEFHAQLTSAPLHATSLAKQALREGYDLVVALGEDGLINEVMNGFFENGRATNPASILGFLPFATSADFIKTVGLPGDFREVVKRLDSSSSRPCDVGLISCRA
jgi:diacylglycerol kinase family enzyme